MKTITTNKSWREENSAPYSSSTISNTAEAQPEAEGASAKPRLIMLVPHEPTLDPRIQYTARSLSKEYEVTVISVVQEYERRPSDNYSDTPTYTVIRIPFAQGQGRRMLREYIRLCFGSWSHEGLAGRAAGVLSDIFVTAAISAAVLAGVLLQLLELPIIALLIVRQFLRGYVAPVLRSRLLLITPFIAGALRRVFDRIRDAAAPRMSWRVGLQVTADVFLFTFRTNGLLLERMRELRLAPDVLYVHDVYALQAAVIMKRQRPCRVVYDSHEFYPHLYSEWPFPSITERYERFLVRYVDLYLAVSPQLAEELQRLYKINAVEVIPNVEPRPSPTLSALRTRMHDLANGRLKVLYQGSFAPGRGLEEVLRAWRSVYVQKAALFLRGPRNQTLNEIEKLAADYGLLEQSVFVLDPVLERDLIAGAAEADVGLIPYKTESPAYRVACPNKLSQYLHAGTAILANKIPFVERMVSEHTMGLCYDVNDPQSFVSAVNTLASQRVLLAKFQAAARNLCATAYSWERYEPLLLALTRKACAKVAARHYR